MPRPRSLTPETIAQAALDVIDREGLAALSMRAVASELRLSTMALYRYVDDRDGLERLVVDLVLGQLDLRPPKHLPWRKQVTVVLERVRATVSAHPAITPLTLTHRHRCQGVKRIGEAVLGVLAEAGLPPKQRAIAFRTLLSFLIGALQGEYLAPLTGSGTVALAATTADYPILAETARHARAITPAQEFTGGLELILRGIDA